MEIKKQILKILLTTSIITLPLNIYAQNDITIDNTFTSEDGFWAPGMVNSKDFNINNNKEEDIIVDKIQISLESSRNWKTDEKLDVSRKEFREFINNTILTLRKGDEVLFENNLRDTLREGIILNEDILIKSQEKQPLNLAVKMNTEMGNDAQSLENIFNIGVSYKVDPGDGVVSPDTDDKLPQTGGIINSTSLIGLGSVSIAVGLFLNRKKNKGDSEHEEE